MEKDIRIEVKSIAEGKKGVPLSSSKGWTEANLPKILAVIERSRKKMTALPRDNGTKSKTRDIEVTLGSYYLYHFEKEDTNLFVKWPGKPSLKEVWSTNWEEDPEFLDRIRAIAKKANKDSSAPVKLVAGKNGSLCRIEYKCPNHFDLPKAPLEMRKRIGPMIDPIVGARLRLWKDHTENGGWAGYLDEEMAHWEDREGKETGLLEVHYADGKIKDIPGFRNGRQCFWGGFALELVLSDLNDELNRARGGNLGSDFTIDDLADPRIAGNLTSMELKRIARKLGKHFILRSLHERYGVQSKDSDFSRGSTVTLEGLKRLATAMAKSQGKELRDISSKKKCVSRMLEMRGLRLESEDVSRGGTVTAYSLLKIWL